MLDLKKKSEKMQKVILLILILSFTFQNRIYSQNDNDAFAAALIGVAAVAASIEQHKETIEQLAIDIMISDYPDYSQFRLKVIGLGGGGEAWSNDGRLSFVPLGLTIIKDGQLTDDRKLFVLFLSKGWISEYGLDYTKISSEIWERKNWNNLICKYSEVNSPYKLDIVNNKIPVYEDFGSPYSRLDDIPNNPDQIIVKSQQANFNNKNKKNKNSYEYRIFELQADSFMNVADLDIHAQGLKFSKGGLRGKKLVFPFFNLKGDDYLISEYSSTMKVFANENKIGLFQKSTQTSMLLNNFLVNKVHDFMNYDDN